MSDTDYKDSPAFTRRNVFLCNRNICNVSRFPTNHFYFSYLFESHSFLFSTNFQLSSLGLAISIFFWTCLLLVSSPATNNLQENFLKILGKRKPYMDLICVPIVPCGGYIQHIHICDIHFYLFVGFSVTNRSWYIAFKDIYSINENIKNGRKK